MSTSRRSSPARPRARRVTQTAALTMGALAVGTAVAPAALAVQEPDAAGVTTPETADTAAPRVLTPAPVLRLGSEDAPVDFGIGKAMVSIAPEPGSSYPDDVALDLSGATVQVTVTGSIPGEDPSFLDGLGGAGTTATCTTVADGTCVFPTDEATVEGGYQLGTEVGIGLYPGVQYTIEQVTPPTSGQLLLPSTTDRVVHAQVEGFPMLFSTSLEQQEVAATVDAVQAGDASVSIDPETGEVTTTPTDDAASVNDVRELAPTTTDPQDGEDGLGSITFFDPGAYRTISATVTDDRDRPVPGAEFALCTVPGEDCTDGDDEVTATTTGTGTLTFPGSYLPGSYRVSVESLPSGYALSVTSFSLTVGAATDADEVAVPVTLAVSVTPQAAPASTPADPTTAADPTTSAEPTSVTTPTVALAATSESLAYTGFDAGPVAGLAAGLVATGTAVLVAVRRRRVS